MGARPALPSLEIARLALRLVFEEAHELEQATEESLACPGSPPCEHAHVARIAHELADLVYVTLGMALRFGIDLSPVFEAVHAANMAKAHGPRREDGKLLKPPGWVPADVRAIIERQK